MDLEKIRKLLALAKSDNKNEANAALRKAQELLAAEGIENEKDFTKVLADGLTNGLTNVELNQFEGIVSFFSDLFGSLKAEPIKKKLLWVADAGLVKKWIALLADYICEANDCIMFREASGIWAAGTEKNLDSAQSKLEELVVKLQEEAKNEATRRTRLGLSDITGSRDATGKRDGKGWLKDWRLARVEDMGEQMLSDKTKIDSPFASGEISRVAAWLNSQGIRME